MPTTPDMRVIVKSYNADGVKAMIEGGFLSREFGLAVKGVEGIKLKFDGADFRFSAKYEDFKALVQSGIFSPAIKEAFEDSDRRMTAWNAQKQTFWQSLWDYVRYRDAMMDGKPVRNCPTEVKGMDGVELSIKRYDIA